MCPWNSVAAPKRVRKPKLPFAGLISQAINLVISGP